MAHFAKIASDGFVIDVIPLANEIITKDGVENEDLGKQYLAKSLGGDWVQTSYNGTFRKNFASRGYMYNAELDAFIPRKPFRSWVLNETTCQWEAPSPAPTFDPATQAIYWDEDNLRWVIE
jgi:hypothetical protein